MTDMSDEEIAKLKREIELLQGYGSDVIYRLRYDNMRYDYISPNVEKLLGFNAVEVMELNLRSLIEETRIVTDDLRPVESFEALENSRKRGEVLKWQADYRMRTKDGKRLWVSDISYPWFDEAGAIIGSIGTLRDITERVEAETRVNEEAAKSRQTDSLTRFASRTVFFEKLDDELKRVKRSRADVSVMLVALDAFEELLEKRGRATVDRMLKDVAELVRSCLRETDLPARVADSEMAICLPETPAEGAFWVGERIREAVLRHQFKTENDELLGATVSIGVAGARFDDNHVAADLFKTAQSRLFIARHTGQNQVSFDELLNFH